MAMNLNREFSQKWLVDTNPHVNDEGPQLKFTPIYQLGMFSTSVEQAKSEDGSSCRPISQRGGEIMRLAHYTRNQRGTERMGKGRQDDAE